MLVTAFKRAEEKRGGFVFFHCYQHLKLITTLFEPRSQDLAIFMLTTTVKNVDKLITSPLAQMHMGVTHSIWPTVMLH